MYIPDITERFPEGFGGVDMTPSFFGEPVGWSRAINNDIDDGIDIPYEKELRRIEIGMEIENVEFDGGITIYKIVKFNKNKTRVYVTETWINVDGTGKRRPHWCNLKTDELGDKFQPDASYDSWIRGL